jgi:hypothetical protein
MRIVDLRALGEPFPRQGRRHSCSWNPVLIPACHRRHGPGFFVGQFVPGCIGNSACVASGVYRSQKKHARLTSSILHVASDSVACSIVILITYQRVKCVHLAMTVPLRRSSASASRGVGARWSSNVCGQSDTKLEASIVSRQPCNGANE